MHSNLVVSVFCVCLLGLSWAADDISQLFSFDKLAQYSSLASCFALIHEDFAYCNQKAEEKGRAYLEGVDESSEWVRRIKCCGTWKLRDCWVRFAKQKCSAIQAEQVHNLPYTFMKGLEKTCQDYPPDSDKCRFPVWLIVIIVLVAVLALALGVYCGVRCYRRRKLSQIRRQLQSQNRAEEQKLKSPAV